MFVMLLSLQSYSQDTHAQRGNVKMFWKHFLSIILLHKKEEREREKNQRVINERQRELLL